MDPFVEHRPLLFTVAYELLGSASDADDVVQEAWLRWSAAPRDDVVDPRAYAVRIVTRLALNQLRTLGRCKGTYVGEWLPEPLRTRPDVADDVLLAEAVSMAMLVVLDSLGPVERAVFVLREVFGFDHGEIAEMVDKSADTVRQASHRARSHVQARRPRHQTSTSELHRVMQQFAHAAHTGDTDALLAVIAPDVVLVTDGGGARQAALRPIVGIDRVARFLLAVRPEGARFDVIEINGAPALTVWIAEELDSVLSLEVESGAVRSLYVVRNPQSSSVWASSGELPVADLPRGCSSSQHRGQGFPPEPRGLIDLSLVDHQGGDEAHDLTPGAADEQ